MAVSFTTKTICIAIIFETKDYPMAHPPTRSIVDKAAGNIPLSAANEQTIETSSFSSTENTSGHCRLPLTETKWKWCGQLRMKCRIVYNDLHTLRKQVFQLFQSEKRVDGN